MKTLKESFTMLQYLGLWRPVNWSSGWKIFFYDTYTWSMIVLLMAVILSQFIKLMSSIDDVEAITNNSFILLTWIGDCCKGANILIKRDEIVELTNMLNREPCRPNDDHEIAIQRKFDRTIRSNTLCFAAFTGFGVSALVVQSLAEDITNRSLPFEAWLPFDYNETLSGYTIVYTHQIFTLFLGAAVSVGFDTLVPGLMMQTVAQLQILKHRYHEMPKNFHNHDGETLNRRATKLETELIVQRVEHQLKIFKFAETSNNVFGVVILLQCTISALVLCLSVLELSKVRPLGPEFTSIIMYLTCMITEIFIYCFCGTEVITESVNVSDAIYEMDWTTLSVETKRSLLTIMIRSLRPIKFSTIHIITLNLDSFNSLIKLSYSIYNVLQQSHE